MIHATPDAISLRGLADRRYIEINAGFTRLLGYASAEVLGKTAAELHLVDEGDKYERMLDGLKEDGMVCSGEFHLRTCPSARNASLRRNSSYARYDRSPACGRRVAP